MTIENKEEDKKETVDFQTALDAIEKKVTEKLSQGLSSIEDKISAKSEKDEPADDWDTDDDEEFLSKKSIPDLVTKITKEVTKTTNENLELKSKKYQRDSEARRDFPELVIETPVFNKKFYDEVGKEITSRVSRGKSAEDIDLVYDSAAAVAARGIREGWYTPRSKAETDHQFRTNREDHFDRAGAGKGSSGPSEEQVQFASRAGLSKERLAQLLKKTGNYR